MPCKVSLCYGSSALYMHGLVSGLSQLAPPSRCLSVSMHTEHASVICSIACRSLHLPFTKCFRRRGTTRQKQEYTHIPLLDDTEDRSGQLYLTSHYSKAACFHIQHHGKTVCLDNCKWTWTGKRVLLFKSLGSLRNVHVFERKAPSSVH
jgi:hypothetical protein